MTKAVFTTKSISSYDDLPEVRYHFPKTYRNQVERAIGDWIVYYEPRRSSNDPASRGGAQVYFATARLVRVVSDPAHPDHFYAEVEDYLQFTRPVPFREGTHYYESGLEKLDGSTNKGAFGRAVRNLSDAEYDLIWLAGFGHIIGIEPRVRPAPDVPEAPLRPIPGFEEERAEYICEEPPEQERRIIQ